MWKIKHFYGERPRLPSLTNRALEKHNPYQCMPTFAKDHVIILPHAEDYRDSYTISLSEVLSTLNEPELNEGLSNDRVCA
jgi:hypothetical protein